MILQIIYVSFILNRYRLTVLRALPHLHKLDNIDVKPEEVHQAKISGLALPLPNSNIRLD